MRDYELMVVVNPDIVEEALTATIEKVNQSIVGMGGTVTEVNQLGRRRLAYPINHFEEGNYILTRFKLEPGLAAEVESGLLLSTDILRHLLIRLGEEETD